MRSTPHSMTRTLAARLAVLTVTANLAVAGGLGAQQPFGPEFRVNTYTTGTQRFRSIAARPGGPFVVTWESAGQDGSQYGVFAQRYAFDPIAPLGPEFRVNTHTTSDQILPQVAFDQDETFLVVWQSNDQDGDGPGVFGQRYAPWGPAYGGEFRVNSYTTQAQGFADVAGSGTGFMVVWQSAGQDGSDYGIFGQRYDVGGAPLGSEFRVNTYTPGAQRSPAVTLSGGAFVVTWEGEAPDDDLLGIRGQRYSIANGAPLGGEFRVNSYTTGNQRSPALDGLDGELTIVWQSDGQDGSGYGVFAQRYNAGGSPAGPEFQVNIYTTSSQSSPAVSVNTSRITVLWQSDLQDGSAEGIYWRGYWFGSPFGPEFRLNTFTTGPQTGPGMAYAGWPRWISPWTSAQDPDGSLGVYAVPWFDLPVELQTFVVE
jgi:hypothetical protein